MRSARSSAERAALSLAVVDAGRPLHSWPETLAEAEWWACSHPERPAATGVWWDENCPACRLAYEAHQRLQPDFGVWFKGALTPIPQVPIDAFVESGVAPTDRAGIPASVYDNGGREVAAEGA